MAKSNDSQLKGIAGSHVRHVAPVCSSPFVLNHVNHTIDRVISGDSVARLSAESQQKKCEITCIGAVFTHVQTLSHGTFHSGYHLSTYI